MKTIDRLKQYEKLKREFPDTILLFRIGDFYEMFQDDAKTVSRVLGLALTEQYNCHDDRILIMCGFPCYMANLYLKRLEEASIQIHILKS